jgi:hypothetical protein
MAIFNSFLYVYQMVPFSNGWFLVPENTSGTISMPRQASHPELTGV